MPSRTCIQQQNSIFSYLDMERGIYEILLFTDYSSGFNTILMPATRSKKDEYQVSISFSAKVLKVKILPIFLNITSFAQQSGFSVVVFCSS